LTTTGEGLGERVEKLFIFIHSISWIPACEAKAPLSRLRERGWGRGFGGQRFEKNGVV